MIGLLIAGHGKFASTMRQVGEHILGKQEKLIAIEFRSNAGVKDLEAEFANAIKQFDEDDQVLLMIDLWGGTPYQLASKLLEQNPEKYGLIAGINLQIILESFTARVRLDKAADLANYLVLEGKKAIHVKPELANPINLPKSELPTNNSEHINFTLVRIDSRLLHSQIAASWAKTYPSDRILVVSDTAASDPLTKKLMIEAAPTGVKANVIPVERLVEVYKDSNFNDLHAMIIFDNPASIVDAVKQEVKFNQINVGSMVYTPGKTRVNGVIALDEQDKENFNYLIDQGINFDVRRVPSDESESLTELLNRI